MSALTTLCLLIALKAPTHTSAKDLSEYLARRDYHGARSVLMVRLARDSADASAMRDIARVYDHQRLWDSSAVWWQAAVLADSANDSAIAGYWRAVVLRDQHDSLKSLVTRSLVAAQAERVAADTSAASLALAYDGFALSDSAQAAQIGLLLAASFPESPGGHRLIGTMFYDSLYPVWSDDTLKLPIIRRFLARFPVTEWRQTFYQYLVGSLFALRDSQRLLLALTEMIQDDTLDPFRYRLAAAFCNRITLVPHVAEAYARKAIELEPFAKKPANKPPEQWYIDYTPLVVQSRIELAEALILQGRFAEAVGWLNDAIGRFTMNPQLEFTPAAAYCLLGLAQASLGDTAEALMRLAEAMNWGDSRSIWTTRAESLFARFAPAASILSVSRQLLAYDGACFTDVTDSVGLAGRRETRVAWGDYDNDGYDDLLLNGCCLFRNDSGHTFVDVTESSGIRSASGRGGIWADYDNDGWLDFWMSGSSGSDLLWQNNRGCFVDVTSRVGGPADTYPTEGAAWADFDNNGWVDLYCANYEDWATHTHFPDRLWRNYQGTFVAGAKQLDQSDPTGQKFAGRGVSCADFDDDGDADCFVANYRLCENLLWCNLGDGTFENLAGRLGVSGDEVDGWYGHTIGATWGDFDNDGDLDLFTADLAHPRYIEFSNRSRLYENQGPKSVPRFRDRRADLGIRYEETHSDPAWADVDNDGDLDLYITSVYEGRRSFLYENQLLSSTGGTSVGPRQGASFAEVTWLSGTRCYNGWGCAFADYDNDGDQDLVVGSGSGLRLFRNDTKNENHWVKVKAIGRKSNRSAIGCRITVARGRFRVVREVEGGKGTTSQNSFTQHFGLGRSRRPVTVSVRFGSGVTVTVRRVRPDQLLAVEEP